MSMVCFIIFSSQKSEDNLNKIERNNISNVKNQTKRSHRLATQKLRRSTRVKVKPKYFHLDFNN